jgi:hypothetical protein
MSSDQDSWFNPDALADGERSPMWAENKARALQENLKEESSVSLISKITWKMVVLT